MIKLNGTILGIGVMLLFFASQTVFADKLTHKFKNPSFSGIGTGAHYLTIENQEKSRKDKNYDPIQPGLGPADGPEDNRQKTNLITI